MDGKNCICVDRYNQKGPATDCDSPCGGDKSKLCGGEETKQVYLIGERNKTGLFDR